MSVASHPFAHPMATASASASASAQELFGEPHVTKELGGFGDASQDLGEMMAELMGTGW